MALIKSIKCRNGAQAEYWRLEELNISGQGALCIMALYINQTERALGSDPVDYKSVSITFDKHDDTRSAHKQAYARIKEQELFSDASDS